MVFSEPSHAAAIPPDERAARLFLTSDLCVLDHAHFFIRCVLALPIKHSDETFCYGVWSSLSKENFLRYQESYDKDMSGWQPMFGWLSNNIPGYPDTRSLKLSVQPGESGKRPLATLEPTDHPLAIEQTEGISLQRLAEIASPLIQH
jgi:hypothetical protein